MTLHTELLTASRDQSVYFGASPQPPRPIRWHTYRCAGAVVIASVCALAATLFLPPSPFVGEPNSQTQKLPSQINQPITHTFCSTQNPPLQIPNSFPKKRTHSLAKNHSLFTHHPPHTTPETSPTAPLFTHPQHLLLLLPPVQPPYSWQTPLPPPTSTISSSPSPPTTL